MAICDSQITPSDTVWSIIRADNPDLMKQRNVALYYNRVTELLWKYRYRNEANFVSQNQQNWQQLGVFGNHGMWVEELDTRPGRGWTPGPRYISTHVGQMYILENHQRRVDGLIWHLRLNARQCYQRWW